MRLRQWGTIASKSGREALVGGISGPSMDLKAGMKRVFGLDLVLLHAPSVWDFREHAGSRRATEMHAQNSGYHQSKAAEPQATLINFGRTEDK